MPSSNAPALRLADEQSDREDLSGPKIIEDRIAHNEPKSAEQIEYNDTGLPPIDAEHGLAYVAKHKDIKASELIESDRQELLRLFLNHVNDNPQDKKASEVNPEDIEAIWDLIKKRSK